MNMRDYYGQDVNLRNSSIEICVAPTSTDIAIVEKNILRWMEYFYKTGYCAVMLTSDLEPEFRTEELGWWFKDGDGLFPHNKLA